MSTDPSTLPNEDLARLNTLAIEVPIDEIIIKDRVRRDFSHVPDLANSIKEDGLIQPIVLDYGKRLIAGESRVRAHKLLGLPTIRAVFRGTLDEAQLTILECSENNVRKGLTWQERCLSVDRIHRLHSTNAMLSGKTWGVRETGTLLKQGKTSTALAVFIAEYLHANDADIWKCETMADAYRVVTGRKEAEANALLAKATIPSSTLSGTTGTGKPVTYTPPVRPVVPDLDDKDFMEGGPPDDPRMNFAVPGLTTSDERPGEGPPTGNLQVPLSRMLLKERDEDSIDVIKSFPNETFDHCITDWPYAIDMDNLNANNIHGGLKGLDSVKVEHDVDKNLALQQRVIPELYRVLKPNSFFISWMDMMHWNTTYDLLIAAGFKVQRWPLVWHKTSSCMNQSAQTNFTKNYEIAIVARKGTPTLIRPQASSVWTGSNDIEAKALGHPFCKPFGLWNWLFDATSIRGQHILEPFAGRGSMVIPAIRRGLAVTAVECNEEHYNALVVNVSGVYKTMDPKVEFV